MISQFIKNTILSLAVCLLCCGAVEAQTTEFTYQGRFTDSSQGQPTNGTYEMQFRLFDNPNAGQGAQQGATVTKPTVQVMNGIFTVGLDFGAPNFAAGANLYLELSVRPAGSGGGYTSLAPRQPITSAPYAIQSLNAATANNALNLGGAAANQFVQTGDARLSDARNPVAGSGNYIQNTTSPQTSANFNIAGSGTIGGDLSVAGALSLNIVNANTQYNLNGVRFISNGGSLNTFVGYESALLNTTGSTNAFFGSYTGRLNTSGDGNSFFGHSSGTVNNTGNYNSFFGNSTGSSNKSGSDNSFFGVSAGLQSETGNSNSFFGRLAGYGTMDGSNNTFVGYKAGENNSHGSSNTIIGYNANTGSGNLVFASAIGAEAVVSGSDTIVIGKQPGVYNSVIRPADKIIIPGTVQIDTLDTTGGTPLCRNGGNRISACSASLVDENKLQNFSAEIKNQQRQIDQQQELIKQQQLVINDLRKLVCSQNTQAKVCQEVQNEK